MYPEEKTKTLHGENRQSALPLSHQTGKGNLLVTTGDSLQKSKAQGVA